MYAEKEFAQAIRTRRTEMGLTQADVARLSGLSRATINAAEREGLSDLSLSRAARLLESLGLGLTISPPHPRLKQAGKSPTPYMTLAARLANVSYRDELSASDIADALAKQEVPARFWPHFRSLLEEAPLPLLAGVVEQAHADLGTDRQAVWQGLRQLAHRLQVKRDVWEC